MSDQPTRADASPVREEATGAPTAEEAHEASERPQPSSPGSDRPWYRDPPKLVGVLGFLLAVGTLGERVWVRDQEQTEQQLQLLRDATAKLADIQGEYLEALAAAPANVYALGVAKNTKRQMYLQTAAALLEDRSVRRRASAQILGALAGELMSDGRYELARTYFTEAINAPGADDSIRPFLLRALGQLYRIPDTTFADQGAARRHFEEALTLLDRRRDDTGHLSWAETSISEANLELVYGDAARATALAEGAMQRLGRVKSASPLRQQLEQIAAAIKRGEQFGQTQDGTPLQQPASLQTPPAASHDRTGTEPSIEIWNQIPGQVSGADMVLSVNGKDVGRLSNLEGPARVTLSGLGIGIHQFAFSQMKVYFIDAAKGASLAGSGYSCSGYFVVTPATDRLRANVGSGPNGLLCGVQ